MRTSGSRTWAAFPTCFRWHRNKGDRLASCCIESIISTVRPQGWQRPDTGAQGFLSRGFHCTMSSDQILMTLARDVLRFWAQYIQNARDRDLCLESLISCCHLVHPNRPTSRRFVEVRCDRSCRRILNLQALQDPAIRRFDVAFP